MQNFRRLLILILIDAVLVNLAFFLALWLRFDGAVPANYLETLLGMTPFFTLALLLCFFLFGLYHRIWQYASTGELLSIVGAVTAGTLLNVAYLYLQMQGGYFPWPRSFFFLSWMLTVLLIGASRFSWRLAGSRGIKSLRRHGGKPVLVVGAGDAGAMLAREMKNRAYNNSAIMVGFVDDDPAKQKQKMYGFPILGRRRDIPALVERYGINEIIIAIPSAPGEVIRAIVDICETTPAGLKILPPVYELVEGRAAVGQIRELRVEDLLDRKTVQVDLESMAGFLKGRAVLVTGAGGSIGAELCRQVALFEPRVLLLLDHAENNVYEIDCELRESDTPAEIIPLVEDVRDRNAVNYLFDRYRPQVVFHAAAHKHVPLMEENPAAALKNNALGTWHVARAAGQHRSEVFVLVSTDKAVNPVSVMGATKRVAEMMIQGEQAACSPGSPTRFAAVRFGNVLDSCGSVVPLFRKQIARGGPVTVTHPEMTRYFMTIPEAVQLVIQAGALAQGGEVFILDMGNPMKIIDLARRMIKLAGFKPDEEIKIVFTGVRPGEKLFEEILTAGEGIGATRHRRIFTARPDSIEPETLEKLIAVISRPGWTAEKDDVIRLLRTVLPSFGLDGAAWQKTHGQTAATGER